jgi:hypothetical protein
MPRAQGHIETGAIQRFMDLVKRASHARSRDVRLELADATILIAEIAVLLGHVAALQDAAAGAPVKVDGGSLR